MDEDTGTVQPLSHRVLFNLDLLHHIVSFLYRLPDSPYDGRIVEGATLTHAARVCGTFTDPALAIIWSSLPDLLPLWHVLGPLKLVQDPASPPQVKGVYVLSDEVSPATWAHFCRYAALIREVRLDEITDACIDTSVFEHLSRLSGGRVPDLFPRLRSLTYVLPHPYRRTSLQHVLSPSLRRLNLHCRWGGVQWGKDRQQEQAVSMLLDTACANCPELDDLTFTMFEYPDVLHTAAQGLKHKLRRLDLGSLEVADAKTVQPLADITTLEELHIQFAPAERISVTGFRALKKLSIACEAAAVVSLFLLCVLSPLETLEICSDAPPSAWPDQLAVIAPMVESLKSFKLELLPETESSWFGSETLRLSQLVEPLSRLRNLEAFSLVVRDTQLITDDASFEAAAKAWPRLTSFALDGSVLTPASTLRTLAHFAQHCPSLHTLLLTHLDDSAGLSPSLPLPSQSALRRLSFYLLEYMNIHHPEATGRAIWRMFPNLDVHGACQTLSVRRITLSQEDCDPRREIRAVGRAVWTSVLDVVERLQKSGAAQGGRGTIGPADS